jgi:excisionase family DNA binding protein
MRSASDPAEATAPSYLTVKEVVELARCEHKAVRRAIHLGYLQAFRPTNKLLIRESDAHAWIQSRSRRTVPTAARPAQLRRGGQSPARLFLEASDYSGVVVSEGGDRVTRLVGDVRKRSTLPQQQ